jgi:type I restriction enzyme S subunit
MSVENLITEHLDIWTSAIKTKSTAGRGNSKKLELVGVKKLRELILELAVRGKLVPQDPNDETVSDLLKKIEIEKAKLFKDKKIAKQKKQLDVADSERPFDIPEGWQWVRLGIIGNIFNGNSVNATIKENKYTGLNEGLPFIGTKDVGYGFSSLDYENGVRIPEGEPKFKVAQSGAVLICAEGGSAGKKCGIAEQNICFGNKLFANQLYGNILPRFILSYYLSPSFYQMFSESMTGIIGGISAAKFSELIIPLPPLAYQNKLVAKVDELMALCDRLEAQTESSIQAHQLLVETLLATLSNAKDADELKDTWQTISQYFDLLFTTQASINQLKKTIIELATNGNIISFINNSKSGILKNYLAFGPRNGLSPKESAQKTRHKVLKLGATSYGQLDLKQTKYVNVDIKDESHLWLRAGDILLQRGNSHNYVGSNILIQHDVENIIYPDLMMKLVVSNEVTPSYVSMWLKSPIARQYMWDRMTGTSGTMPKISKVIVENIPIIVPPINIQNDVVAKVDELMALCDSLKLQLNKAQATQRQLTDAIVEQALS